MPRRKRTTSKTGIYHVLIRGINQQRIFEAESDYQFFLDRLKRIKAEESFAFLAFCLMSNHLHLLIWEEATPLAHIMKRLGTTYVYYFNQKYERSGHLFQDRFKSEPIEDDAYLYTVINYIHQNPIRAGICKSADEYQWSSLFELSHRAFSSIDTDKLFTLVSQSSILSNTVADFGVRPFKPDLPGRKPRFSEAEALSLLNDLSGAENTSQFQRLAKERQQEAVRDMRQKGMSIRQAARICGLSKGLVESWLRTVS